MELQQIERHLVEHALDSERLCIDKQPDCSDKRRQLAHDSGGVLRREVTWTRGVENEAERVRAEPHGRERVFNPRDAANFHRCRHNVDQFSSNHARRAACANPHLAS